MAGADRAGVSGGDCLCHTRAALPERRRRSAFCRHGVWAADGARHRLAILSVIPVGLPAALHIATGFGQALFGWHDEQLLLAELGTLAIVWWVGSRGASSSANLQTLVAVLIVALIVAIWFAGDITVADIPFPAINDIDHAQLFAALSVMFWCFVGLEAFAHLASEFKQPERDFPAH